MKEEEGREKKNKKGKKGGRLWSEGGKEDEGTGCRKAKGKR